MLLEPMGKATIYISTSLVGIIVIFLAICFYIGTSNSSTKHTTDEPLNSTSTEKIWSAPIVTCKATCGSCTEITPKSGVLLSPNYPEHYYSPTDIGYRYCQYNINAPVGQKIQLIFEELNLAFTKWSDFLEVVDKSSDNYGKVLATFNAGDVAVPTTTSGESMLVYFEGNQGGYTKNGKAPAWKATYYVIEKVIV